VFYPLYMHRRAAWGAPRRLALAIAATGFFVASGFYRPLFVDVPRARVSCKAAGAVLGDGMACTIEHVSGTSPLYVCWDVVLTCSNGPGGSGRACDSVEPRKSTPVSIPFSALTGADGCRTLKKIDIEGVVVTVE
jgi:hypothetical protein